MDKVKYPTGVENHGGTLRIWFNFKGKRVRENLGVPGHCQEQEDRRGTADISMFCHPHRKL